MVGEHDHDGIRHLLNRQPHGGTFHLPDWMAAPQAGSVAIIAAPRLPLTHLLELRALVDHLVASLPRDPIFVGGHADEESAAHPTGFVRARRTAGQDVERGTGKGSNAVAVSTRRSSVRAGRGLSSRSRKQAGDEQDHR
ncbi:hypothetical protein [Mesorhizobium shonense]|uniref:hypothetical protein n=1 Tax=Mesorhizobium shonense TaxID=1209948 RepID=UPI00339A3F15